MTYYPSLCTQFMFKKVLKSSLLFLWFLPAIVMANEMTWQVVPAKSSLTFTATQNGAPVTGEFKKFTADIQFDLAHLDTSKVTVVVDTTSIADPYDQLADTLKSKEWFNVKNFPQATFTSNKFAKVGDKQFKAEGMLTIRDKTLPITLNFTQLDYAQNKATIKGRTIIKRTAFGIGQGEWADTNTIKDEVKIDFNISAIKK